MPESNGARVPRPHGRSSPVGKPHRRPGEHRSPEAPGHERVRADRPSRERAGHGATRARLRSTPAPIVAPRLAARVALAAGALGGCGALGGGPNAAPPEQLEPAGWHAPSSVLAGDDFDAYARAVRTIVDEHRLPLVPESAAREAELSAPREYPPTPDCAEPRGVALLVHGLSDSAYSLSDVAATLAARCFVARTMLLPGHGTRAGDLLVVDEEDWLESVRHLTRQAAREHERVLLVGVSLGAVLTLSVALEPDVGEDVDALVAIAPAYGLESWRLTRLAPWLGWLIPWVDADRRDDWARYEAIPMRGIASTVRAIGALRERLEGGRRVAVPWMLVQSRDDRVVAVEENRALFAARAASPASLLVEVGRGERPPELADGARWLRGDDAPRRVTGVSHIGTHVSPANPHYGADGDYRACGANTGRDPVEVERCESEADIWYASLAAPAPEGAPSARATFNPAFDELAALIGAFLDRWAPRNAP